MNRQRYVISRPGVSTSTINAVICLRSRPPTIFDGVRAITTSTPALIRFVHQSFSPFRMYAEPSAVGSARRFMLAGSEPAFHSVSANAEISWRATLGRLRRIRMNTREIIAADEKVAGETSAVLERIARGLGKLERFALAFDHLRCVDDGNRRRSFRLCAGFLSPATAGFFRRFERRFHNA